jgi:thioredoxin-like negative regulator of GroEL
LKLEARQDSKRKVKVFSAGCALCEEVIDVVRREAGSSSEVIVRNMKDARALARAAELGIRSIPAVVVDGRLASRAGGGVDIQALKRELGKTPKGLILST